MKVTFLGTSSCIPDIGSDCASFIINGKHLVDTGWYAALRMRRWGYDPLALESVILTHLHQDHYIGLPQILFYNGLRRRRQSAEPARPLKIIGPHEHIAGVVEACGQLLQLSRFPELRFEQQVCPIRAGQSFDLDELHFETFAARHVSGSKVAEEALVYKVTDTEDGTTFAFTGDTHYHEPIADFVVGVQMLVHDGAHTAPREAASIAKKARVGRLMLIHYSHARAERVLSEAREVFLNSSVATDGDTVTLP